MSTNKETMKVIAEGLGDHKASKKIKRIARLTSDNYEEAMESVLDEETDTLIRDMVLRAYMDDEYEIAASIILLTFILTEMDTAAKTLARLAEIRDCDCMEEFMDVLMTLEGPFKVEFVDDEEDMDE